MDGLLDPKVSVGNDGPEPNIINTDELDINTELISLQSLEERLLNVSKKIDFSNPRSLETTDYLVLGLEYRIAFTNTELLSPEARYICTKAHLSAIFAGVDYLSIENDDALSLPEDISDYSLAELEEVKSLLNDKLNNSLASGVYSREFIEGCKLEVNDFVNDIYSRDLDSKTQLKTNVLNFLNKEDLLPRDLNSVTRAFNGIFTEFQDKLNELIGQVSSRHEYDLLDFTTKIVLSNIFKTVISDLNEKLPNKLSNDELKGYEVIYQDRVNNLLDEKREYLLDSPPVIDKDSESILSRLDTLKTNPF